MRDRIILDLCGGTGSWSEPYREAGYDVRVVDTQEWLDGAGSTGDVRLLEHLGKVHGILAAPPCTTFARSGACNRSRPGMPHLLYRSEIGRQRLLEGLATLDACCRIIVSHRPEWWALENPVGRIRRFLGPPAFAFDPCDFGDPYTKRTLLWGNFTPPQKCPVEPTGGSWTLLKRSPRARSQAFPGFARAFFEANP